LEHQKWENAGHSLEPSGKALAHWTKGGRLIEGKTKKGGGHEDVKVSYGKSSLKRAARRGGEGKEIGRGGPNL